MRPSFRSQGLFFRIYHQVLGRFSLTYVAVIKQSLKKAASALTETAFFMKIIR